MIDSPWVFILRRIVALTVAAGFYAFWPTVSVLALTVAFFIGSLVLEWFLWRRKGRSDPPDD